MGKHIFKPELIVFGLKCIKMDPTITVSLVSIGIFIIPGRAAKILRKYLDRSKSILERAGPDMAPFIISLRSTFPPLIG